MAYEIGSGSNALTLPNPFKTHNVFLAGASFLIFVAALSLLFQVREALVAHNIPGVACTLAIATVLIVTAVSLLYRVLTQLRFYFGRTRPESLTQSMNADQIKELMRQQALVYEEPRGPISSALLAVVPNLIYAPPPIRHLAEWQFKTCLTLVILTLSLLLTLVLNDNSSLSGAVVKEACGFIFLAYALFLLVRPVPEYARAVGKTDVLSVGGLSLLTVTVLVGPVVATLLMPPIFRPPSMIFGLSPFPHVFVFLGLAFIIYGLFLTALIRQLLPPPQTAVSVVQDTWNISCHPALVMGEFQRTMQEGWPEKIPNRQYLKIDPEIHLNHSAGAFAGEIIEETQPFPRRLADSGIGSTPLQRSTIFCVALDVCALLLAFGFAATAAVLGQKILGGFHTLSAIGDIALFAVYALILGALCGYAFRASYHLWRRFDFTSRIIWLEMNGQYISGRVEQGNTMQGSLKASSSMVQIEGMTFRLWVAELYTITFGKDSRRYIVSMIGNYEIMESLAQRLKTFTHGQATVAKLATPANLDRLQGLNALSNAAQPSAAQLGYIASVNDAKRR